MSASRKINDRERLTSRTIYRANLLGYDTDPFGTIAKNFREIELALQRMGVSAPQSSPYSRIQSKVETNLDMKVDGYEGRISANESDINLLDGRVTVNEDDIGSLDSRTTNLETNSATKTELNNGLATKEPKIPTGTAGQFYAHDKTWKTPPQPDLSGYATTTALNNGLATKEPTVNVGTVSQFWNGLKQWVAVKLSDIAPTTANRILQTNASGNVVAGSIDPINLARTNVPNNFTSKQTFAVSPEISNATAGRVAVFNANKELVPGAVSADEVAASAKNEWQAHYSQGSNPYIRYAKVTTTVSGDWNEYYQQFQIAVGKAFFGNQRYLNGTFLVELGTRNANENLVPQIMFYGHCSSNEQLFYTTTTTAGGVINGIEIWGYSSGSTGTNCIVNVSVVHQRAQYSSFDLSKLTSATAPADLTAVPYMLMQGATFYTSNNAVVGGDVTVSALSGNAGYLPQLDANGKLIKGASNSTSVIEGDLQLFNLTGNRVPYLDNNKRVKSSNVTPTELNYLSGATSNVQAQLDDRVLKDTEFSFYHGTPAGRFRRIATVGELNDSGSLILSIHRGRWGNDQATAGFLFINFGSSARVVTAHFLGVKPQTATRFWIVKDDDANNVRLYSETGLTEGYWRYGVISKAPELNISLNISAASSQFISESANELTGKTEIPFLSMFGSDVFAGDIKADTIETTDPTKPSTFAGGISVPSGKDVDFGGGYGIYYGIGGLRSNTNFIVDGTASLETTRGSVKIPNAQFTTGGSPNAFLELGSTLKLSQRVHGTDKELYVAGGGIQINSNHALKFADHTKLYGSATSNELFHSGYQHGGGRYTIKSGKNNTGNSMVVLNAGHNPSSTTYGEIQLGRADGAYLFKMVPEIGVTGPKMAFYSSQNGGVDWTLIGSVG